MSVLRIFVLAAMASLFLFSCDKDKTPLELPVDYRSADFSENSRTENTLRSKLATLTATAKTGLTTTLNYTQLADLYTTGTPSLAASTTATFDAKTMGTNQWLFDLAEASGKAYVPSENATEGGAFGGYLLNKKGLELTQVVDKGLLGATFYNQATVLMNGTMDLAVVDRLMALFGAHPDFPNTPNAPNNPDGLLANYAAQRDNNDGSGYYFQMKNAFIKLRAAIEAGTDYNTERDEALATLKSTWEKINFATVVYYCNDAFSKFTTTNPSDVDLGKGLHAYSEAVGFVQGWHSIDAASREITDAEIDDLLSLLLVPSDAEASSYRFVTEPVNTVGNLTEAIVKIKAIYGFTTAEMADFKVNWVAVQGR